MALNAILKWFTKLWEIWDVRFLVLLSLVTQAILIFMAPLRKRMPQRWVTICLWSAYLLADAVAIFCVGRISHSQGKGDNPCTKQLFDAIKTRDLHAFWVPFLLLHLGGPDTITAFALEDNELWTRHALSVVIQFAAAVYVLVQSLPGNTLWAPTCLMLVAGFVKYAERSYCLYLASLKSFRETLLSLTKPDPGPNYAKLMSKLAWMQKNQLDVKMITMKKPDKNQEGNGSIEERFYGWDNPVGVDMVQNVVIVRNAYKFFNKFKGLIVDLFYNFHDRDDCRRFFCDIHEIEMAYKVIEIELGFFYDVLYTKASILHSRRGYFLRLMVFATILAVLFLFVFNKKDEMHHIDVAVTYVLLTGAIILEVVAFLNLVFSDWTIALLDSNSDLAFNDFVCTLLTKDIFFEKSRWSESISQFSLLNFCLCKRRKWLENTLEFLRLKDFLNESQYKSVSPLSLELKSFIFLELKRKSEKAMDLAKTKGICSSRGMYILDEYDGLVKYKLRWTFEVEYDASLLMWHIATDILYHHENDENTTCAHFPEFCKVLSDYMLYLLVVQPTVISAVASNAQIRYRDSCAEAEKFFRELQHAVDQPETKESKSLLKLCNKFRLKAKEKELKDACRSLLDVDTLVKPSEVKGDQSKSVFFDGVMLAKVLLLELNTNNTNKWEIMSKVWVELLCYAASHCRAINHAQQVSKGGELVTVIWLLMVHFGLSEQFSIMAEYGEAKIVMRT